MLACMALFAYLWRRPVAPVGDIFARYLMASGVIRFLIEAVRRNPAWFLGLTTAQAISVVMVVVGATLLSQLHSGDEGRPAAASS